MLSAKEKKEMRADGLSRGRRREFAEAAKERPGISRTLNDYMAFLMDVQKIKPFGRKRVMREADKNIL
jgi:hypothetical protein